MSVTYENQRVNFDKLAQKYKEYIALYRQFNNGSVEGLCNFADFYWRMTYLTNYEDARSVGTQGY